MAMKVNGGKKCEKRQKEKKVTTCGNGIKIHCTRVKHKSTSVLEGECDVCTRLGSRRCVSKKCTIDIRQWAWG